MWKELLTRSQTVIKINGILHNLILSHCFLTYLHKGRLCLDKGTKLAMLTTINVLEENMHILKHRKKQNVV